MKRAGTVKWLVKDEDRESEAERETKVTMRRRELSGCRAYFSPYVAS